MDQRILEFIGDLRRAELRISPSEALDALAASSEIGLEHRETFKTALASTLVKEARDLPTFDRIFDLYFLDLEALGAGLKKALGPEDPRIQEMLDQLMAQENMDMDELTELMLRGEGSDMEMAIRGQGQGAGLERLMYFLQIGYFSRKIYDKFDWAAIERDLSRIMQLLEAKGMDPGMLARIRNYLDLRLEAFRRMIRQHVERELERRAYRAGERLTREVLTDKPLFALSPQDQGRPRPAPAAGGEGAARFAPDHPEEPPVRRHPHGGALPAPASREAEAHHPVRRLRLRAQRLALHAPARVELAGVLLACALLRVRLRDRRGDAGLQHVPRRPRHRVGAQVLLGGLPLPVRLRLRLQPLRPHRARVAGPQDHRADPGGRAQQLQRSPGLGHPADSRARERCDLAEPGRPVGLGHRRQRDAALLALVRHRQGMPDGEPARAGRGSSRPLLVAPGALTLVRRALLAALVVSGALVGSATAEECVIVDDFAKGKGGEFPPDWKPRKESGRPVYSIQEMDGRRYLHALAKGLGIQAAKQYEWDPRAYPILAWSWRPIAVLTDSDDTRSTAQADYANFRLCKP